MDSTLKLQIAENFSRAAATYDLWADAHRRIASHLAKLLERLPEHPASILELGCGTGVLSDLLLRRYPAAKFLGLDIAPGMIRICQDRWSQRRHADFAIADIETAPFPFAPDLVASSCALQWIPELPVLLQRLVAGTSPGAQGMLALAELSQGSTPELAAAWEALGRGPFPGLSYRSPEQLLGEIAGNGYRILQAETGQTTVWYPDAISALHSFKGIGAILPHLNTPGLSVGQTRSLMARYAERFSNAEGEVPVTYVVTYALAQARTAGDPA